MSAFIALTTCPDEDCARSIAEAVVTERLAACVNRLAGVRSTHFWDGRLQDDSEVLLIIKTTDSQLPALEARVKALHPYELPEWLALRVETASEAYLAWLRAAVNKPEPK